MRDFVAWIARLFQRRAPKRAKPLLVFFTSEGYRVGQEYFASSAALSAALLQRKPERVELRGLRGASYAQVEGALSAIQKAGAQVYPAMVGNVRP